MRDRRVLQILRLGHCDITEAGHQADRPVRIEDGRLVSECPACAERISDVQLLRILESFLQQQGPQEDSSPPLAVDTKNSHPQRPTLSPEQRHQLEKDLDALDRQRERREKAGARSPHDRWLETELHQNSEWWWEQILEYNDSYDFLPDSR